MKTVASIMMATAQDQLVAVLANEEAVERGRMAEAGKKGRRKRPKPFHRRERGVEQCVHVEASNQNPANFTRKEDAENILIKTNKLWRFPELPF